MKQKRRETICVTRIGNWWTVRFRERVSENGVLRTINRARKLAEVSPECKTRAAARKLAEETFFPVVQQRQKIEPTRNVALEGFVEKNYLPHVEAYLRASTSNSYKASGDCTSSLAA